MEYTNYQKFSRKKLRGALMLHEHNMRTIAEYHGWKFHTMKKAIQRHWGKKGTNPYGRLTLQILETLAGYCLDIKTERKAA